MQRVCYFHLILAKTEIQWEQRDTVELKGARLQILIMNVLKIYVFKKKYFYILKDWYGCGPNSPWIAD